MHYNIVIEYVDNKQKAGKLTLTDSQGNALLKKVPVAIPHFLPPNDKSIINGNLKHKLIDIDVALANVDVSGNYKQSVTNLVLAGRHKLIVNYFNDVVFAPNPTGQVYENQAATSLRPDETSFVLYQQDFSTLFNCVQKSDSSFKIALDNVSFLWFPEKVILPKTDINHQYDRLGHRILLLQQSIEQQALKERSKQTSLLKKDLTILNNSIDKKTDNKVNNKVDTYSKERINPSINQSKRTSYNNSQDDLDAFDVMFMYNNPDLAPMYKPNSMLAWYMYFNNNDIQSSTIQTQIKNVPGFEDVHHCDFKYTKNGYNVELYADKEKTESLGVLSCNNQTKTHTLTSPSQDVTTLKVDDTGLITGTVVSQNQTETSFNFFKNNDSFVGNWSNTSEQGIEIHSGMKLDSDYGVSSSLNNTIDTTTRDTSSRYEPPPPPSNTTNWSSSSDSYSNGSSFSM
jgi:hypothetical protein